MRRQLLLLPGILAGLLVAGLPAQGDSDVVKTLRKAFRRSADREAQRGALNAIGNADSAAVATALIDAYRRLDRQAEAVHKQRRSILLARGGSQGLGPLRHTLDPIRALQDQILERLDALRSKDAASAMVAAFLKGRGAPWSLQIALAGRSRDAASEDLDELLATTGSTRGPEATILLLRAMEPLGSRASAAAEWATSLLKHRSRDVQIQAAKTIAKLGWPGSLRPLIAALERARGRWREQLLDALVVLTSVHPGNNASAWQLWLEKEGGPYLDGTKTLGRGDATRRQRTPDPQSTSGTYFGLDQSGNSILYVIDISLSMRAAVDGTGGFGPGRGPGGRQGPGRQGPGRQGPGRQGPGRQGRGRQGRGQPGAGGAAEEGSRWHLCRKELVLALRSLKPHQSFNIVGFANHLASFDKKMQRASKRNVKRAIEWVHGLDLELETNIYDALELAFILGGRGVRDRYYRPNIDTIFFLSDGAPTVPAKGAARGRGGRRGAGGAGPGGGRMTLDDPRSILAAVRRWNAMQRVTIHTIGIGLRAARGPSRGPARGPARGGGRGRGPGGFLNDLAQQNRGTFVEPKN